MENNFFFPSCSILHLGFSKFPTNGSLAMRNKKSNYNFFCCCRPPFDWDRRALGLNGFVLFFWWWCRLRRPFMAGLRHILLAQSNNGMDVNCQSFGYEIKNTKPKLLNVELFFLIRARCFGGSGSWWNESSHPVALDSFIIVSRRDSTLTHWWMDIDERQSREICCWWENLFAFSVSKDVNELEKWTRENFIHILYYPFNFMESP